MTPLFYYCLETSLGQPSKKSQTGFDETTQTFIGLAFGVTHQLVPYNTVSIIDSTSLKRQDPRNSAGRRQILLGSPGCRAWGLSRPRRGGLRCLAAPRCGQTRDPTPAMLSSKGFTLATSWSVRVLQLTWQRHATGHCSAPPRRHLYTLRAYQEAAIQARWAGCIAKAQGWAATTTMVTVSRQPPLTRAILPPGGASLNALHDPHRPVKRQAVSLPVGSGKTTVFSTLLQR